MSIKYNVGDVIAYTPFGGGERIVFVETRERDIKNGKPGFDGHIVGEDKNALGGVWGYDHQITRVVMEGLRV